MGSLLNTLFLISFHHCYYPCIVILHGSYYADIFDVPNEGHLLSNLDSAMHYTWPTSASIHEPLFIFSHSPPADTRS